jgi:prepilin-type N-terminal cleavage/methylation domain-containing protein
MKKGLVLIELLVVIAIIGILASVVMGSLNSARVRGLDARMQADLYNVQLALQIFYDSNKRMPANQTPGQGYCNNQPNFLFDVVNAGYLPRSIQTPAAPNAFYCYYDYGQGNDLGAMLVTVLQAAPPSTTGLPGTCRPFPPSSNWCDQSSNTYYCLCNPY